MVDQNNFIYNDLIYKHMSKDLNTKRIGYEFYY